MSGARTLPIACEVADDESVEAAVATSPNSGTWASW